MSIEQNLLSFLIFLVSWAIFAALSTRSENEYQHGMLLYGGMWISVVIGTLSTQLNL